MLFQDPCKVPDLSSFKQASTFDEATPTGYASADQDSPDELLYAQGLVSITCQPVVMGLHECQAKLLITGSQMDLYIEPKSSSEPYKLSIAFDEIVLHATTSITTTEGPMPALYMHVEPSTDTLSISAIATQLRKIGGQADSADDMSSLAAHPVLELTLRPVRQENDDEDLAKYTVTELYNALSHMAKTVPAQTNGDLDDEENEQDESEVVFPAGQWITAENADQFIDAVTDDSQNSPAQDG